MRRVAGLIVGLGNPGIEYAWTPHNLGFLVVDKLAEQAGIRVTRPEAKSYVGLGKIAGHEVSPREAANDDELERPGGARTAGARRMRALRT